MDTIVDFTGHRSRFSCRQITVTVSETESIMLRVLPGTNETVVLYVVEGQDDECVFSILKP